MPHSSVVIPPGIILAGSLMNTPELVPRGDDGPVKLGVRAGCGRRGRGVRSGRGVACSLCGAQRGWQPWEL